MNNVDEMSVPMFSMSVVSSSRELARLFHVLALGGTLDGARRASASQQADPDPFTYSTVHSTVRCRHRHITCTGCAMLPMIEIMQYTYTVCVLEQIQSVHSSVMISLVSLLFRCAAV